MKNERFKKVFNWVAGVFGVVVLFLLGKRFNRNTRERLERTGDNLENGRRTADSIQTGNNAIEELSGKLGEHIDAAGQANNDAQDAVRHGLDIITEIKKRNELE